MSNSICLPRISDESRGAGDNDLRAHVRLHVARWIEQLESGCRLLVAPGVTQHQGFVYTNGTVNSAFNYPGAVATSPTGINDSGEIIGTWTDSVGFVHGFYWTSQTGFTSFDVPKTTHTIPVAVNASGVIAGYYAIRQDTAYAAFMCSADGVVTTITIPHAQTLRVTGINAQGTIAGTYDSGKEDRGFLYQP